MKIDKRDWPVLIISAQFDAPNDEGFRLRELVDNLEEVQDLTVQPSYSYEDGLEIFMSQADLGAVIVDWDLPAEVAGEEMDPEDFVIAVRSRNKHIPIILLTERLAAANIPTKVLEVIDDALWKTSDTIDFLAGRIEVFASKYIEGIYPPFFGELVEYAQEYKYAWHTPGHMGGQGFLHSPAGVAMHKFYGENVFRADLSISVPELGSLLDHTGVVRDAEDNSAHVFGADDTYYVLNGTSNVNQIIWRSQLVEDEIAFVDRNCHKSLNYAMVITNAYPVYMVPRRNKRGTIGPCRLSEFSKDLIQKKISDDPLIPDDKKSQKVKMSALTNSTYDGICYNVVTIKQELEQSVENLHFDEAWYAYARFHPIYENHYGMADKDRTEKYPPIFVSHSTHKLLTAFSQASMLHIRSGSEVSINRDEFNESYMMHGSTSPQYSMIASLDVATKMMDDNGYILLNDNILEAIRLRQKVTRIAREKKGEGSWFFEMWQPRIVDYKGAKTPFEDVPEEYLAENQSVWVFDSKDNWHGFEDMEEDYAMLDPIKLTFMTPGLDEHGNMQDDGIPASIVTDYLINHGIVCEKTDYYSFLLLNSLGTTKAKQCSLLTALLHFKELYDRNARLDEALPELAKSYPETYRGVGLHDHCRAIHQYFKEHSILDKMQAAFQIIPDPVMKPSDAYHAVVRKQVEFVELDDAVDRVPAVMVVPYPPGIPIMMGGEAMNDKARPIFEYLQTRQNFENEFPGYSGDIHGVERDQRDGKSFFRLMCIKKDAV
ncbi:Orn/Lys/Arg decarboxylase N-terminal domain-containing protein [Parendozoicomonas haliclonae]|uniref:Biodegradative arginine decarboxylase n=1 Tax=Parendozoicomonas haliclonae TaxID=1960125 RepID=A0A1X7AKV9_9GAMM|nr:Orn/Lys/Arg decarboxylase N-terminal domain-containing protein [Parendozoicomonas haliclonae]SMA48277.1 Biodegradative arginine decarboxylase [Parendozoicomonas haliclonae]